MRTAYDGMDTAKKRAAGLYRYRLGLDHVPRRFPTTRRRFPTHSPAALPTARRRFLGLSGGRGMPPGRARNSASVQRPASADAPPRRACMIGNYVFNAQ